MTTTSSQVWTPLSMISWGTEYLKKRDIDSPRLTVELLLSHVLQCRRIDLYVQYEKPLTPAELSRFKALFERRLNREPLQYILGKTEFMGLEFSVSPAVLIPRPETERLVEAALEEIERHTDGAAPIRVLDIGTGCGNIAVSLASLLAHVECTALDVSQAALEIARYNAAFHNVSDRVHYVEQDFLATIPETPEPFDMIVSNPPYIPIADYAGLQPEINRFEPKIAATDGDDGMIFYRRIAALAPQLLAVDGACMVEIAYNQGRDVRSLFSKTFRDVTVLKDYSGHDRVVCGRTIGP